jgi:hypothetical protein
MFEVLPFNIRVDYLPRRVDLAALRAGNFAELVNMVQWKVHFLRFLSAGIAYLVALIQCTKPGNFNQIVTKFYVVVQGIELQLKHVKAAGVHGLSSFSSLCKELGLFDHFMLWVLALPSL